MRARSVFLMIMLIAGCAGGAAPPVSPTLMPSRLPAVAPSPTFAQSQYATAQPAETAVASPFAAPDACRGRAEVALSGIPAVARMYLAAWNEHDADARSGILEEVWADDATYLGSAGLADAPITGRRAMSDVIARNQGPADHWFEVRAWQAGYAHHGRLLMPWRHCAPDGPTGVVGTDYAELDSDGRISRAVGFSPIAPDHSGLGPGDPNRVCAGPDSFDWSAVPDVVRLYGAAWNERDAAARRAIIDEIWAVDGLYVDSFGDEPSVGRAAFDFVIDYGMVAGNYIELSAWSQAETHDGWYHARWRDCCPAGAVFLEGTEVIEAGPDGRIRLVSSFWNEFIECTGAECQCGAAN